jgi:hypothetical protein
VPPLPHDFSVDDDDGADDGFGRSCPASLGQLQRPSQLLVHPLILGR